MVLTNTEKKSWTEEEEQLLWEMRQEGIPYKFIGIELNRSVDSCKHKYCDTYWASKPWFNNFTGRLKHDMKKAHLERIARLQDKRSDCEQVKMDIIADRLEMAVKSLPPLKKPVIKPTRNNHSPEDVALILGDLHVGHHHTKEETGGLSEYSVDIFKARMENLKQAVYDIYDLHSKLYRLPTLHIMCIGDVVAGMNAAGAWSSTYINSPILDQTVIGSEAVADLIYHCLGFFQEVKFYGIFGNHGRAAMRGLEKEYVNWDYICYKFLESRFKGHNRVSFVVPMTWWHLADIRNHKFLMMHGEDVKAQGVPLKGVLNSSDEMMKVLKVIPDYTIVGHFHAAGEWTTNNGKILINGSFMGPDVFALKNLQKSAKAEQKIFGIHDKRGKTWGYDIDLDASR